MKNLKFIALFIVSISLLPSCNYDLAGQTPTGVRFATTAWVLKSFSNIGRLDDANRLWDRNGNEFLKWEGDANNDGTNDAYADALGTTKVMVIDYGSGYNLVHNQSFYTPCTTSIGTISYKVTVDAYSTMEFTNVNPKTGLTYGNRAVTRSYAVQITPE